MVTVRTMKTWRGGAGSVAALSLSARWRSWSVWSRDCTVVGKKAPVHFEKGSGWSTEPLWMLWRRKQSLGSARISIIILSGGAHGLFTVPAELSQLCINSIALK